MSGVANFDRNSMYLPAMMRIGQKCGYPKRLAQLIPRSFLVYPLLHHHYVVRIRITRINNFQQIPLVLVKLKSGSIKRHNQANIPQETFVINKITLENWLEFCDIEFELIEGLYWYNGGKQECAHTTVNLKQLRNQYKHESNNMQQDVKLIMNMGYCTLVLKKWGSQ